MLRRVAVLLAVGVVCGTSGLFLGWYTTPPAPVLERFEAVGLVDSAVERPEPDRKLTEPKVRAKLEEMDVDLEEFE